MKILFKLTFKRKVVTELFWLLWILTLLSALNISMNIATLKYYDSQGLNKKLILIWDAMKFFSKKLLGHEIFSSLVLWATKNFLKNL